MTQLPPPLNLPPVEARIERADSGALKIFDPLRQKMVALTPEEWVRQHFIAYLISKKGFPRSLMANELALTLNGTRRRCDTVVFDRTGRRPMMIVEYKAPHIAVSQRTFDQIARYNIVLKTPWLVVSNGMNHYCCRVDSDAGTYSFVDRLPTYSDIAGAAR